MIGWVPSNGASDYRVAVETRLIGDEWSNGYGEMLERTDIRQRIQLDAFRLLDNPTLRLFFDADIGSDLGPPPEALQLGVDDRRTVLNLYAFEINAQNYFAKTDIRLGRHLIHDAIGMDGIDGLTIRSSHLPAVDVLFRGGIATRRSWWAVGPDLSYFDGMPQRRQIGYTIGAGLESRGWTHGGLNTSWRRIFDPAIIRDEVGANARWQANRRFAMSISSITDVLHRRMAELGLGFDYVIHPHWRTDGRVMYHAPRFAADTIWNAFATEPFALASVGVNYHHRQLRIRIESIESIYELAADDGRSPLFHPEFKSDARAHEAYAQVAYRLNESAHPSDIGFSGRLASGFGGKRILGAATGRLPIFWPRPHRPVYWQNRLGLVWFDDPDRERWDGLSGWILSAFEWNMEEGLSLEASVEGYIGERQQTRMRSLVSVKMENWW